MSMARLYWKKVRELDKLIKITQDDLYDSMIIDHPRVVIQIEYPPDKRKHKNNHTFDAQYQVHLKHFVYVLIVSVYLIVGKAN